MSFLDAALRYAELGYRVFPCWPGRKNPIPKNGFHDATTNEETIAAWWEQHPNANIAIAADGLLVVDVDDRQFKWLENEPDKRREIESADAQARTPRGGFHYFFKVPDGVSLKCTQGELSAGVDTRTTGGYVLVAPSVVSGKSYRFVDGCELDSPRDRLKEPPGWLIQSLTGETRKSRATADGGETIPDGRRNGTLASRAGSLRRSGFSQSAIAAAIHQMNMEQCSPPLPHHEVEKIAESVSRYEPDPTAELMSEDFSDVDLGPFMEWFESVARAASRRVDQGGDVLELTDWDEVTAEESEPIIDGLILPGRWTSIAAGAKQGKTTFILATMAPLTLGIDPYNEDAVEPVKVLHVDYEVGRLSMLHDFLSACGWDDPKRQLPGWRHCDQGGFLSTKRGAEILVNTVLRYEFKIVVIDGINGAIDGAENDDGPWRNLFQLLIAPLKSKGVAVVSLSNVGHSEDGKGRPRGSSVQLDKPDVIYSLKRTDGGVKLTVHNNCRRSSQFHLEHTFTASGFDGSEPIRYRRADEAWPEGTAELAAELNRLGVPLGASRRATVKILKDGGVSARTLTLGAALKYRRIIREPLREPAISAVGNHSGNHTESERGNQAEIHGNNSGNHREPTKEELGTVGGGVRSTPPRFHPGKGNLESITGTVSWIDLMRRKRGWKG
jgi:hypothetical protein